MVKINEDETVDDLLIDGLKIIQKKKGFRFSLDAILLAHFASLKEKDKVIDLGTGTGIIALLISTLAQDLDIYGVELQGELVEMAQRSILLNNLVNISISQGDIKTLDAKIYNDFNLVVSNPPYFPLNKGRINPDPQIAIARHEIHCNLEQLISTAARILKPLGRFAFIYRIERLTEVFTQLRSYKLEPKRMRLVHPQITKEANLVLLEAAKNAKPGLVVERPLIIYKENSEYSQEILDYYGGETYAY